MAGFVGGLVIGLFSTVAGMYFMCASGKGNRTKAKELAEALQKITQLEDENKKLRLLERFTPRITVRGTPATGQFISVSDPAPFRVIAMDYLSSSNVLIASQAIDRSGVCVQVPIDESRVTEIQRQGCDPEDGTFSMSFRIHIELEGVTKTCLFPVKVAVNAATKLEPMPLGMPLPTK